MKLTDRNTTTSDRLTTVLSYGALLLLGYLVFLILAPFFIPLAWSAVLAIFFHPAYERLKRRYAANWAALLCTVGVTLMLIAPVLLVFLYATREALEASALIRQQVNTGVPLLPRVAAEWVSQHLPASWQDLNVAGWLRQAAEKIASYLASSLGSLLKNVFSFFVKLFILLFALFFVFRDGEGIMRVARRLIPFDRDTQEEMLRESRGLIIASVALTLVIAAVQGALGGIAFALAGLPAPVFLALLVGFCSIVPVVGSGLVWFPAMLWLAFSGHWGKALLVLGICGGIASLVDNFLRPLLLRNRTKLNDLLLFLSILGGLEAFGLLGLILGPTIVAAALGLFRVHMDHQDELERESA